MGPVSVGTINDLMNLAQVVKFIQSDGGIELLDQLRRQMEEISAASASVSEREAALAQRESDVAQRETEAAQLLAGARGKNADLDAKLEAHARRDGVLKSRIIEFEQTKAEFEASMSSKLLALEGRETDAARKLEEAEMLRAQSIEVRNEYQAKIDAMVSAVKAAGVENG